MNETKSGANKEGSVDGYRISLSFGKARVDLCVEGAELYQRLDAAFCAYRGQGRPQAELHFKMSSSDEQFQKLSKLRGGVTYAQRGSVLTRSLELGDSSMVEGGEVVLRRINDQDIQAALMWFLPRVLRHSRSFLIHGAGVLKDGVAYVFVGPAGAGKSTAVAMIADIDSQVQVMADDLVILERSPTPGAPVNVYTCPFGGRYSRMAVPNLQATVKDLFILNQAEEVRLEALAQADASGLLGRAVVGMDEADCRVDLMKLVDRFTSGSSHVKRLSFTKDPIFWFDVRGVARPEVIFSFDDL